MDKFFKACADAGDDIIEFLRGSPTNALIITLLGVAPIALLGFVPIVGFAVGIVWLAIWIVMICSLYRKRAL